MLFGSERNRSDIAIGCNVTANELDYTSLAAYRLLTDHTERLHQHVLQPFVTRWAHQANSIARYTALTMPDHWPNKSVRLIEGDFLTVFPMDGEFDAVVTLFFIDMADNLIDFLTNIHRLLKPGGVWINLGRKCNYPLVGNWGHTPFPHIAKRNITINVCLALKWGSYAALRLSAEEVIELANLIGLDVDLASRKSIDSLYVEQPDTLLKFTYGKLHLLIREIHTN
jgi:SAM-dependent methyltransferase